MLKKTVEMGSLYAPSEWGAKFTYRDEDGKRYHMPMAGKTGTPQNWSDAWAVGYSPYYTTAVWFGFDKPGNTLGVNLTGSTLAGPVWANFMREVHQGLPLKDFARPSTGIVDVTVCTKSGLLKTPGCPADVTMPFLEGTQPTRYCDQHDGVTARANQASIEGMRLDTMLMDSVGLLGELKLPELRLDQLPPELRKPATASRTTVPSSGRGGANTRTSPTPRSPTSSRTTTRSGSVQTSRQNTPASRPALDFRGSDFEGEVPSPPSEPDNEPAALPRNTRNNPLFSDEEFELELPDYNPLLD
jgi:penicillin-binding protein 1A